MVGTSFEGLKKNILDFVYRNDFQIYIRLTHKSIIPLETNISAISTGILWGSDSGFGNKLSQRKKENRYLKITS